MKKIEKKEYSQEQTIDIYRYLYLEWSIISKCRFSLVQMKAIGFMSFKVWHLSILQWVGGGYDFLKNQS